MRLLVHFSSFFREYLIRIQQGFQNSATRYLKQILLNLNTEFQAEEWNNFLRYSEKQIESSALFKSKLKSKLLSFENEITYF